ncbi:hypothetical protein PUNSTDRAFT_96866 [Punctularia strigosozonata HHB-11173 SS5]|uniref:uncharacterized protein n=1 Tax=Punctularia strigosozonata (strain HHB-11173) TaxID=741275 RepID=UPI00044167EC|nr:uncharacterized protein PUNSTDRAFT_96866 [Punctularia strigosozonata HHB-11173 SS5]EIN12174.1 hypothetical protein PUNSTDRAFT_96866 [Punctularia strigosozonata HHB-11173 SS5]
MFQSPSLVGSVLERKPSSAPRAPAAADGDAGQAKSGFPSVQHRSKSAFARAREEQARRQASSTTPSISRQVPIIKPSHTLSQPVKPAGLVSEPTKLASDKDGNGDDVEGKEERNWRDQISEENERRVLKMSTEERAAEVEDILQRFGANIGDILLRARARRQAAQDQEQGQTEKPSAAPATVVESAPTQEQDKSDPSPSSRPTTPPPHSTAPLSPLPKSPTRSALSRRGSGSFTRPPSRADRKLRFADLQPGDVHVYDSAPPSPRKRALALPPPSADDADAVSLGTWKGRALPASAQDPTPSGPQGDAQEGTPEDIRRRFFPSAPAHDPSLEWITSTSTLPSTEAADSTAAGPRFDLRGAPIAPALTATLPTHLGLHHHAEGAHAGYTLADALLLTRSTVGAQRGAMLSLLTGVVGRLGRMRRRREHRKEAGTEKDDDEIGLMSALDGKEEALRGQILSAATDALDARGGLGARAVELMWACIVDWEPRHANVEGIELQRPSPPSDPAASPSDEADSKTSDILASLPIDRIFPRFADALGAGELPRTSLHQILAVLHRLAQHSNEMASAIVSTPNLVPNLMRVFLLADSLSSSSSSPSSESAQDAPDPAALRLLTILASSSRQNANALVEPADALLRFLAVLPPASPHGPSLATSLAAGTLRFYTALASYGLYASVTATAAEPLARLGQHVLFLAGHPSMGDAQLVAAYARALEVWMVCARDPHRTTPAHDLRWSQVVGWGWGADLLELNTALSASASPIGEDTWSSVWNALAAWLEGARVNAVKAGETERTEAAAALRIGFEAGPETIVVNKALEHIDHLLHSAQDARAWTDAADEISRHAATLAAAARLWLVCLPARRDDGPRPSAPPFALPFNSLSSLCARVVVHPIWARIHDLDDDHPSLLPLLRPLSALLSMYLRVSRWLPTSTSDVWFAQALAIAARQLPGDEAAAEGIIADLTALVTEDLARAQGWAAPPAVWAPRGVVAIAPLLVAAARRWPTDELYISPLAPTPESIGLATTLRLPRSVHRRVAGSTSTPVVGLPLPRDWLFHPLDHLLRSGTSDVMRSLPGTWDTSEVEVVRAVLVLTNAARAVLLKHSLPQFAPSRDEVVFGCMKVFMLEHGQQAQDADGEVYRDPAVGQLMTDVLASHSLSAASGSNALAGEDDALEAVAARFLGPAVPFFQFYTDFVALYDAVSFGHPLFARLLLPPLSTRYAVDYRRLLWADYAHALRTVRTLPGDVPTGNIREFLYPVERDPQVLAAYLRALLGGRLMEDGFLRLIAVHHVSASVWPDLRGEEAEGGGDERAEKLLRAVLGQADHATVREVVRYTQRRAGEGAALLPPDCLGELGDEMARARLQFVKRVAGEEMMGRVAPLLEG